MQTANYDIISQEKAKERCFQAYKNEGRKSSDMDNVIYKIKVLVNDMILKEAEKNILTNF